MRIPWVHTSGISGFVPFSKCNFRNGNHAAELICFVFPIHNWVSAYLQLAIGRQNSDLATLIAGFVATGQDDACCVVGGFAAGMVGLAPKWVRLAPNGTNPGLFQIRFQCIWRGARRPCLYEVQGKFAYQLSTVCKLHTTDVSQSGSDCPQIGEKLIS